MRGPGLTLVTQALPSLIVSSVSPDPQSQSGAKITIYSLAKNKGTCIPPCHGPWLTLRDWPSLQCRDASRVKFHFIFISCPLRRFFTLVLAPPTNYAIDQIISSEDMKDKSGQKGGKLIRFFIISLIRWHDSSLPRDAQPSLGCIQSKFRDRNIQPRLQWVCHRFKYDPNTRHCSRLAPSYFHVLTGSGRP